MVLIPKYLSEHVFIGSDDEFHVLLPGEYNNALVKTHRSKLDLWDVNYISSPIEAKSKIFVEDEQGVSR